jgi:hypothetical protein
MLIAAMPKTASTSLIYSLGQITGLPIQPHVENMAFHSKPILFKELSKYHKSVYCKTKTFYEIMAESKSFIFREHVIPEKYGLDFLIVSSEKIVILYRNPYHIIDNYDRLSKVDDREKLLQELCIMRDFYVSLRDNLNRLLISYRDLVKYPQKTIKKILAFFGVEAKHKIVLQKKKYTGVGVKRL